MEERAAFLSLHELSELMQALSGFLMLLTGEGKLLYLSDSVSEHLGHSMVSPNGTSMFVVRRNLHRLWEKKVFSFMFLGGSGGTGGQRVRHHRCLRSLNRKDQPVHVHVSGDG